MLNSREKILTHRELKKIEVGIKNHVRKYIDVKNAEDRDLYVPSIEFLLASSDNSKANASLSTKEKWMLIRNFIGVSELKLNNDSDIEPFQLDTKTVGYVVDYLYQRFLDLSQNIGHHSNLRQKHGAYFTPYQIAEYIVKSTLRAVNVEEKRKILDPAVGTGVFISAVAHYLINERGLSKTDALDRIYGYDKDSVAIQISKVVLAFELGEGFSQANLNSIYHSRCCDFLMQVTGCPAVRHLFDVGENHNATEKFDVIVMNPPYDRLKADRESEEEKRACEQYVWRIKETKQYNLTTGVLDLYRLFLEKSLYSVLEDGRVGVIIPQTFVADQTSFPLRQYAVENRFIEELLLIPEYLRPFEGVSQALVIAIFNKTGNASSISIDIAQSKDLSNSQTIARVDPVQIKKIFPKSLYLPAISNDGYALLKLLSAFPAIGSITFLVNRRGELDLTLYAAHVDRGSGCLLRGRDIKEYQIINYSCVDDVTFLEKIKTTEKYEHVSSSRLACQQIVNKDATKRIKFVLVGSGVILANSLNYIVLKKFEDSGFDEYALLGILNSIVLDWRFNITSSNNHVNNYELDELPFPAYAEPRKLKALSSLVKSYIEGSAIDNTLRSKIEKLVLEIYQIGQFSHYLSKTHACGNWLT